MTDNYHFKEIVMEELKFLREIKSVTFCSEENGKPKARIIDVMFVEDNKIFFTTARGKSLYRQIKKNPNVAVVGMDKSYRTVRIHGKVKQVEHRIIDKIFELNPMMNNLYEGDKREILEPFCLYQGSGETFDLGVTPPRRERFSFGGITPVKVGYSINKFCTSCGICKDVCPEHCITNEKGYVINGSSCIECGSCYEKCPSNAIDILKEF